MSGTKIGGIKARNRNLEKDPLFYVKIGKIGGEKSRNGGFFGRPELAREAGRKGGSSPRRVRGRNKVNVRNLEEI